MNSHLKQTIHQGSTGFSRTVFLQNPLVGCFRVINKVIQTIQLLSNVCYKKQQEVGDGLSVCVLNILPKVSSLLSLLAINVMKVEIQIFQTVMSPHVGHLIKGSSLGTAHTTLAPCLVWYRYTFCRQKYVFYFSGDLKRSLH